MRYTDKTVVHGIICEVMKIKNKKHGPAVALVAGMGNMSEPRLRELMRTGKAPTETAQNDFLNGVAELGLRYTRDQVFPDRAAGGEDVA